MASNIGISATMPPTQMVERPPANIVHMVPEDLHPAASNKKTFTAVGVMQICIGILSIIFGGAAMGVYCGINYPGYGIWGGVWFIICGSLALETGKSPNSCKVIAGLVVSILTCLEAFAVVTAEVILASSTLSYLGWWDCDSETTHVVLHSILAFLAFAEFITAIVHSAFCCSGTCGSGARQDPVLATNGVYVYAQGMRPHFSTQQAYGRLQYYPQHMVIQAQEAQMTAYPNPTHVQQPTSPLVYDNEKQAI